MKSPLWMAWCAVTLAFSGCAGAPSAPERRAPPAPLASAAAPNERLPLAPEKPSEETARSARNKVAEMLKTVARFRHLVPRADVSSRVLARDALLQMVRAHVDREVPPEIIHNQGEFLVGLGLVAPSFDYEAGTYRLLEAQLAGFYEPHDKTMYLAADLPPRAAEATLAHELVHALQDQYYDLGSRLAYEAQANDRESAIEALAEGDATSAMMDVLLSGTHRQATDVADDLFANEVEGSMSATPDTASLPRILRASLVAPYVDGVLFVHALRRKGDWEAVDRAWRSPPESTEQILHLDKFEAKERGEVVPLPSPPALGSWKAVYDDVFGEQGLRLIAEEWLPRKAAAVAAADWAGDHAVLYRSVDTKESPREGQFALAWWVRFDPSSGKDIGAAARRTFRMLSPAVRAGELSDSKPSCAVRPKLGPMAMLRSGRDLVIVAGPYRRSGTNVASTSVCAQSVRWATEILSSARP
jgi:hypothetical protein